MLESFLVKSKAFKPAYLLKETPTQVFSFEHCEILKNTFSDVHLWTTASVFLKSKLEITYYPKTSFSILGFTKYFLTCPAV